jgi:4-amino-4-deoxy-L-arabinose transferase-like glycosyltransferase
MTLRPGRNPFVPSDAGVLLGLAILAVGHTAASFVWLARDNQPPLWDMALHQTSGLAFHDLFAGSGWNFAEWFAVTGAYPPFYHHLLALAFALGRDHHLAVWANLPATLALILCTYVLGRRWFSPVEGVLAATVLLCFPYVAWVSRETIIDYTLAAVVLGAIVCLDSSVGFSRRGWSLAFGALAALAALTKWIGPAFLILPALWALCRAVGPDRRVRTRNFLDATILGGGLTLAWYLPKLPEILAFLRANTLIGAAEGEPPVFSLDSLVYYLRLLEGEQLHGFFFLAFVAGVVFAIGRRDGAMVLLLLWVASGYVFLTLLRTKDPRFTLPYLPAVALLAVSWVRALRAGIGRQAGRFALVGLSVGHFALVSFGWSALPEQVLLAEGYQGSYSWDWRLYAQRYQGLLGPPQRADWPQGVILEMIVSASPDSERVRIGIVPDLPRFNHENLRLEARFRRLPIDVVRISELGVRGEALIDSLDFLIVSEGEQGMVWTTEANTEINDYVFARPDRFMILDFARVPSGPALRIYRVGPS